MDLMIMAKRGSGKDTLVDYLVEKHGYKKIRLAEYVSKACEIIGLEPTRENLIKVGTELGRDFIYKEIWIDKAQQEIANIASEDEDARFIISDVRFFNEYRNFFELGFFPIKICCDSFEDRALKRDGHLNKELMQHETETNVDHFSGYEIFNNGTINDFYKDIDRFMKLMKKDGFVHQNMAKFEKEMMKKW